MKSKPQQTTTTISVFLFTINFHYDDDDNQREKKTYSHLFNGSIFDYKQQHHQKPKKNTYCLIDNLLFLCVCVYFSLLFSFQNYKHASCVCMCFRYTIVGFVKQNNHQVCVT